jgi:hypothetical protein
VQEAVVVVAEGVGGVGPVGGVVVGAPHAMPLTDIVLTEQAPGLDDERVMTKGALL